SLYIQRLDLLRRNQYIDADDLIAHDRELKRAEKVSAASYYQPDLAVDNCGSGKAHHMGERNCAFGPSARAANFRGPARAPRAWSPSHHDIGIEDRQQPLEIALTQRGEECVYHFPLTSELWIGRLSSADAASRTAGQLPCGVGSTADDTGDLI